MMSEKQAMKKIGINIPMSIYTRTKLASVLKQEDFQVIVALALQKWLDEENIPHPSDLSQE